ncbi:MAG TPA: hypothetical protein GXX46_06485 [Peptococcaceae bacterium]|nr:hypothetical protein [Peptococcaceae bacterium]
MSYKDLYYKANIGLEEFNQRIERHLIRNDKYDCEKIPSGVFFRKKRKGLKNLFSPSIEIVFSPKSEFSLISVEFHNPSSYRYINLAFV